MLAGYKVKDVLMKDYRMIDKSETVKEAVQMLLNGQSKNFLTTENGKPIGTLSRDEIIKALSEKGENEIIFNIMNKNLIFLDTDSSLENAYQQMHQHKLVLVPVTENNKLVGVVDTENILEFIMVKNAEGKTE